MGNKNATATILIDASLLCLITLFAALCLGAVYEITKKPIEAASKKAENKAFGRTQFVPTAILNQSHHCNKIFYFDER